MSKKLAEKVGLVEGEKAIYPSNMVDVLYLRVVTVTDVIENKKGEIVVLVAEFDGYIYPSELYSKKTILEMLGEND